MGKSRVFFPQTVVDRWLLRGEARLTDSELYVRAEGLRYRLVHAVRVLSEVTGAPDPFDIAGKVKSINFVSELGAELLGDSMIIGDNAYETVLGWLGMPIASHAEPARPGSDEELLARFLGKKL